MKKIICTVSLSISCLFIVILCFFVAYPVLTKASEETEKEYAGVIRIWHVDSFEGGKGSRAAFLNSVARAFEKDREGVLFLVTSHTAESAAESLKNGEKPDLFSFGSGLAEAADILLPVSGGTKEAQAGGKSVAVPWCRGCYFLFEREEGRSDDLLVSEGKNSMALVAAALSFEQESCVRMASTQAYVSFLAGNYKRMIGTQRDVWRLRTRNEEATITPLPAFSDLYQYIGICADDEKRSVCEDFIAYLLSDEVQASLSRIGMLGAVTSVYGADDPVLSSAEEQTIKNTVYAFLSQTTREEMNSLALSSLKGDKNSAKKLENYLL